jgi:hypothetical protein
MAIDFLDKEVKKLRNRFNNVFATQTVFHVQAREASLWMVIWADLITSRIKEETNEKRIEEQTREFCMKRDILNNFFDMMELQQERSMYAETKSNKRITASG